MARKTTAGKHTNLIKKKSTADLRLTELAEAGLLLGREVEVWGWWLKLG